MSEKLLQAVFSGEWEVPSVVRWLSGDTSVPPPPLDPPSTTQAAWKPAIPTPEAFQAYILRVIRDHADSILSAANAAADKKATTSRVATPQTGINTGSTSTAASTAAARPSRRLDPSLIRRLEAAANTLSNGDDSGATHSVPIHPHPGAVDDSNFPSLSAATAPTATTKNHSAKQPSSSSSFRRRIQPTQVAEVEVSTEFVGAKIFHAASGPISSLSLSSSSSLDVPSSATAATAPGLLSSSPSVSKLASRLGDTSLEDVDRSIRNAFSNSSSLLSSSPSSFSKFTTPMKKPAINSPSPFSCSTPPPPPPTQQQHQQQRSPFSAARPPPPPPHHQCEELPREGQILATLYAFMLSLQSNTTPTLSLVPQLTLLLQLLTIPVGTVVAPSAPSYYVDMLHNALQAHQFAATVLCHSTSIGSGTGRLLLSLGPQVLNDIQETAGVLINYYEYNTPNHNTPTLIHVLKELQEKSTASLAALQSRQLHTEKAFNTNNNNNSGTSSSTGMNSSVLGGFGLHMMTADRSQGGPQVEHRRQVNREVCRDAWFVLMKKAATYAPQFGFGPSRSGSTSSGSISTDTSTNMMADVAVFSRLQEDAFRLLRALHRDNYEEFSELIAAAAVQAAATGEAETMMDRTLNRLAGQDPSKIRKLSGRMGGGGGGGGGATKHQHQHQQHRPSSRFGPCSTPIATTSSAADAAIDSTYQALKHTNKQKTTPAPSVSPQRKASKPRLAPQQPANYAPPLHPPAHKKVTAASITTSESVLNQAIDIPTSTQGVALEGATATAASLLSLFPSALRPYILFLEAADSYRLNASLEKVIAKKLKTLQRPGSGLSTSSSGAVAVTSSSIGVLGERVVAANALAGLLGYLCFAKKKGGPSLSSSLSTITDDGDDGSGGDGNLPLLLDISTILSSSLSQASSLVRTVPWILRYLSMLLVLDPGAASHAYYQHTFRQLGALRSSPQLLPSSPAFGPAGLCLRCLLDDFDAQHSGWLGLPTNNSGTTYLLLSRQVLEAANDMIDARYFEVCCPSLVHCRRLFSTFVAATAAMMADHPYLGTTDASYNSTTTTPHGHGNQRPYSIRRIQPTAPLSTSSTTKATPVVGVHPAPPQSIAITQAQNSLHPHTDPIKVRLQQTFLQQYSDESSPVKLKDVVEYAADVIGCNTATDAVSTVATAIIKSAIDTVVANTLATHTTTVVEHSPEQVGAYIDVLHVEAEKETASAMQRVIERSREAAQEPIKIASARAVAGLLSPQLGKEVVATAAAVVAEAAAVACAGRLVGLAQKAVRLDVVVQQATSRVKERLKVVHDQQQPQQHVGADDR